MKVPIKILKLRGLWLLLVAMLVTIYLYDQYVQDVFWMFFSCLHAYLIQVFCAVGLYGLSEKEVIVDTSDSDYQTRLSQYKKCSNIFKILFSIGFIIIICLDAFPFLASNQSFCWKYGIPHYEGGVLVTILTMLILLIWIGLLAAIFNVNITTAFAKTYDKMLNDEKLLAQQREHKEREIQEIKTKYGERVQIIETVNDTILISEEKRCVRLKNHDYRFEDILGCRTTYDESRKTITSTSGKSKTSNANMLKRAVVGGVLTSGIGALAGAVTAKKDISMESTSHDVVSRYYSVHVTINSIYTPTIEIKIGEDARKSRYVSDLFNIIIVRSRR